MNVYVCMVKCAFPNWVSLSGLSGFDQEIRRWNCDRIWTRSIRVPHSLWIVFSFFFFSFRVYHLCVVQFNLLFIHHVICSIFIKYLPVYKWTLCLDVGYLEKHYHLCCNMTTHRKFSNSNNEQIKGKTKSRNGFLSSSFCLEF